MMREEITKRTMLPLVVPLLFLVAGCAAPIKHLTPSGRPEVTITGRVGEQVVARITDYMLNRGYNVKTATNTLLVFEKPIDNVLATVLLGSRYDSTPAARVTYTTIETETSTRVVASLAAITNPGSAFERVTPMDNSKDSVSLQQFLNELKSSLEKP